MRIRRRKVTPSRAVETTLATRPSFIVADVFGAVLRVEFGDEVREEKFVLNFAVRRQIFGPPADHMRRPQPSDSYRISQGRFARNETAFAVTSTNGLATRAAGL